jgi:hypothetical protein
MLILNAIPPSAPMFTPSAALTTLLTVESLLFAGIAASASLNSSTALAVSPHSASRRLALATTLILTAVAVGAGFAWWRLFGHAWPSRMDEQLPVACLAIGIVAQPIVSWTVVRLLFRR